MFSHNCRSASIALVDEHFMFGFQRFTFCENPATMIIRLAAGEDGPRIEEILRSTEAFSEDEVICAMDLVEEAAQSPGEGDYIVFVAVDDAVGTAGAGQASGYACYGPTPLADGVFDLYWIAVDPEHQGSGVGQALLTYVEQEVLKKQGRMVLIETSSKDSYGGTIRFYEQNGYREISRIKDFYRLEDDKIVFSKRFES